MLVNSLKHLLTCLLHTINETAHNEYPKTILTHNHYFNFHLTSIDWNCSSSTSMVDYSNLLNASNNKTYCYGH